MPEDDEMMTSDGDTGAGFGAVATGAADGMDEGEDPDVPGAPPPGHDPARGGSLGTTVGDVIEGGSIDTGGAGVPTGSGDGHAVDRHIGEPQGR